MQKSFKKSGLLVACMCLLLQLSAQEWQANTSLGHTRIEQTANWQLGISHITSNDLVYSFHYRFSHRAAFGFLLSPLNVHQVQAHVGINKQLGFFTLQNYFGLLYRRLNALGNGLPTPILDNQDPSLYPTGAGVLSGATLSVSNWALSPILLAEYQVFANPFSNPAAFSKPSLQYNIVLSAGLRYEW